METLNKLLLSSAAVSCLFLAGCTSDSSDLTSSTGITASSYSLVDTGQTACYNTTVEITCPAENEDFYGQDAQFTGTVASYTDNGDGTITDNNTGLMWQPARTPMATEILMSRIN